MNNLYNIRTFSLVFIILLSGCSTRQNTPIKIDNTKSKTITSTEKAILSNKSIKMVNAYKEIPTLSYNLNDESDPVNIANKYMHDLYEIERRNTYRDNYIQCINNKRRNCNEFVSSNSYSSSSNYGFNHNNSHVW